MKLRCLDADMQDFRDLLGRLAFAHELQDLPLARCQLGTVCCRLRGARVHDCLGGTGADVEPATAYFLDSVYQVVGALAQLGRRAAEGISSYRRSLTTRLTCGYDGFA